MIDKKTFINMDQALSGLVRVIGPNFSKENMEKITKERAKPIEEQN